MYRLKAIRAAAITTNAYVVGNIVGPKENFDSFDQLNLAIKFTIGSLTNMDIKIEYSNDGSTYYQETFAAVSGGISTETAGVHRYAADGNYTLSLNTKWRYAKISVIGNGTVTSSSVTIDAIVGNA